MQYTVQYLTVTVTINLLKKRDKREPKQKKMNTKYQQVTSYTDK